MRFHLTACSNISGSFLEENNQQIDEEQFSLVMFTNLAKQMNNLIHNVLAERYIDLLKESLRPH